MLLSLLFPCSYFLWGYSITFFSILWWTQSSLILSFHSNISTYCHTFLSKCGLTLFQKCRCICLVLWWPWRCAAHLSFERLCCENTADWQLLHLLIPSQAAQSHRPSTARVPEQGLICWIWDSFNGQPWLGDSHQLGWGFLRAATVKFFPPNPPFFCLFTDISPASQSEGSGGVFLPHPSLFFKGISPK